MDSAIAPVPVQKRLGRKPFDLNSTFRPGQHDIDPLQPLHHQRPDTQGDALEPFFFLVYGTQKYWNL